jgi:hypothetical protein
MSMMLVLLLGSAAVGFMLAPRHNVCTVAVSSPILAVIAATAVWFGGFGLLASIAITFACLTVSQMAYVLLLWLSMRHEEVLANKPPHNQSRQHRQGKIRNKHTQQKRPPSHLTT